MSGIGMQIKTYCGTQPERSYDNFDHSLWTAVVHQALKDIEDLLELSTIEQARFGNANIENKYELERTLYEMSTIWFSDICLSIDVDANRIHKLATRLFEQYNYNHLTFGLVPKRRREKKRYDHKRLTADLDLK